MRKLVIAAVTAACAIPAAPAAAQYWRIQPAVQRQIQLDINRLENRIELAQHRRTISKREAAGLRRDALALQRFYYRSVRDGLSRPEVAQLETGVNRLHQRLRLERRDWDGRRG
jgi:hypothetical protein